MELIDKSLYVQIKIILEVARMKAYSAVNFAMVEAYWNIGKSIVEKQGNDERAEYGSSLIKELSMQLTADFGKGFEESNLRRIRQFYITFPNCDALRHELSWTYYRLLLKIENRKARQFYFDECVKSNWSTRQLERQINSFFYERILSNKEKEPVKNEIHKLEKGIEPQDVIRDPYVLEFLGLEQAPSLYEKDLEQALIDHPQKFLLELGRGFSFVARQKGITFFLYTNHTVKCNLE